jgi:DNA-binding MarR family transcriptional regulator
MVQSGSTSVYESAPYILPISWGAVAGTLIWRGKVRSSWSRQGYDYDTFRLVARTRGSPIRVRLLNSVATAKNRLQLANELDVDWKTIDNHVEILTKSRLVQQMAMVGTTRYYVLTEHGRRVLSLLSEGQEATAGSQAVVSPLGTIGDSN